MNARTKGLTLLTSLACAVAAYSQTSTTSGAIHGTVKSKKAGAVASATVALRNVETGFTKTGTTDSLGAYQFPFLPLGVYEITVTFPGLKSAKDTNVRVSLGQTTTQNFSLDSAEATAEVVVMAEMSGIDTVQINTQTSITQDLAEAIPINGRNFTDLVQLTPGAAVGNTSYYTTVEGARGVQNNLQIDGTSFNSKFNGEQRGGTRIPFSFGQDSIKELQVITNTFDAQYGDAVGAVVNAVTKSGTNETTGMAFMLFRPTSLVAKAKPVPYDAAAIAGGQGVNDDAIRTRTMQQIQLGFNLGGPIVKDKLHYFINVEGVRKREQSTPAFGTGTTYSNTFFSATGMGGLMLTMPGRTLAQERSTSWTDEQKNVVVTGRLDWTINSDHRATLRLNSQNYTGLNDIYPGVKHSDTAESGNSEMDFKSLSTVLELQSVLTSNLLNEARLQLANEKRPTTPNSTICAPVRIDNTSGTYNINAGQYYIDPRTTDETTTQFQDNLTFMTGDWTFKGGVDLQYINMKNRFLPSAKGNWSFSDFKVADDWFNGLGDSGISYTQSTSALDGVSTIKEKYLAGYLQGQYDGFFQKRLLLSLGVRYTGENWSDNPNSNPKFQGLDREPNDNAVDPRFGFSLDLFGNAKTVIRGGYGWFSVSNPAQTASGAIMNNGLNLLTYSVSSNSMPGMFASGGDLSVGQRWSSPLGTPGSITPVPVATLADPLGNFGANTVTPTLIDPNAKMTQARATSLAVEQDLGNSYFVSLRATYKQFRNLQYAVNINLGQHVTTDLNSPMNGGIYNDGYATKVNAFSAAPADRPGRAIVRGRLLDLSNYGDVILSKYDGEGLYRSLVLEGRRTGSDWGFRAALTYAKAEDNNSNERATLSKTSSALTENPADPLASYALSDNDHKFRATFAWYAPAVYGIRASGITTFTTGRPFNAVYYNDVTGDGNFIDTVAGRNTYRQPNEKTFDLQIARTFKIVKQFSLEGIIQVFNVFNWANQYTSLVNFSAARNSAPDSYSASFGKINKPDYRTREVQFTLKARF